MPQPKLTEPYAFMRWVDMGKGRSVNKLLDLLKEEGWAVGREKLNDWRRETKWDDRLAAALEGREKAAQAAQLRAEAGEPEPEAIEKPQTIEEAQNTIQTFDVSDLSAYEKIESTAERLNALVSAMTQFCLHGLGELKIEKPSEYCQVVNATRDLARAAGDVHRAMIQPISKAAAQAAAAEEAKPVNPTAGAYIPDDLQERLQLLIDPPRLRQT